MIPDLQIPGRRPPQSLLLLKIMAKAEGTSKFGHHEGGKWHSHRRGSDEGTRGPFSLFSSNRPGVETVKIYGIINQVAHGIPQNSGG